MNAILSYFWKMCLLRASPENIPANLPFLSLIVVLYFVVSVSTNLWMEVQLELLSLLAIIVLNILYIMLVVSLLTHFKKVIHRLPAVLAALFGCNTIISIVTVFLSSAVTLVTSDKVTAEVTSFIWLIAFTWSLMVAGRIFMHALKISQFLGFFLALVIEILYFVIISGLFPATGNS